MVVAAMSVDELRFVIDFLSPFRISTGAAAAGVNATIDRNDPLPATSLKGVMRATAKQLLGEDAELVGQVFGDAKQPCRGTGAMLSPLAGRGLDHRSPLGSGSTRRHGLRRGTCSRSPRRPRRPVPSSCSPEWRRWPTSSCMLRCSRWPHEPPVRWVPPGDAGSAGCRSHARMSLSIAPLSRRFSPGGRYERHRKGDRDA